MSCPDPDPDPDPNPNPNPNPNFDSDLDPDPNPNFDSDPNFDSSQECKVRDSYASRFGDFRPLEKLVRTEHRISSSMLRADLRSIDSQNVLRLWEFKLRAGQKALGQILIYVAITRYEKKFIQPVRGVIAAFEFDPTLNLTIEMMGLGIELVRIPEWIRGTSVQSSNVPKIPFSPQPAA